ncbi:hypothetical protein PF005_g12749 [Phytophthora fragariae]|uniref:Uncharacterized protein n=1 Tax=Phytophthora fragariae TaxID=53985 RepID=A0A6A4DR56_9STRA|nr:hypothetical protein PF003_g27330 [Phytophthora fragariae]KAE8936323.1 hypothetical protein PF009_g13750 [Phytophthora fragariae]KAE9005667.1 hypothetical protein PF011_g11934 [Phytophthora fragariae]KAE9122791.1 hypothetical protein PF007_g7289 [Phytophthora fragariae]KAE9153800.1 hypothetical protein PF006_g2117 [Phytophthora fragariae]
MSGTTSKRSAHATLGAHKCARCAPAKSAAAPATAKEAPNPPAASLDRVANAPLAVRSLLAADPTATSAQVEAALETQPARTSAELLRVIDEVLGPATGDEEAQAHGVGDQGAGTARDAGTAVNGGIKFDVLLGYL